MAITFIANDPAAAIPAQQIVASPNRPAGQMAFKVANLPVEQVYAVETEEFVAWQAREAALRTLATFESFVGPLQGWIGRPAKLSLDLIPNEGVDLNAFYDRRSVSFFSFPLGGGRTVFSGASADVVAHEVGHAILDALRPDLWDVDMFEVPAFHEGFGDCIAIMAALADRDIRAALLAASPQLDTANFVEGTAEELSLAIGIAVGPTHNAAQPRRAMNAFKWALPQSLPDDGGPGVLINEIHSFGQLASGCYYELIREIFLAGPGGEAGLLQACQVATRLLAQAAAESPIRPRFLETVGRTMVLADQNLFGGANETHLRAAFERHDITLSVANFLAPRMALVPASTKKVKASSQGTNLPALNTAAKRLLNEVMEVSPKEKFTHAAFTVAGADISQITTHRSVDLTGLSEALANVKSYNPYSALVGNSGGVPAVLGAVDPGAVISSEVRSYVATLIRRGQVDLTPPKGKSKAKATPSGRTAKKAAASASRKSRNKKGAGYLSEKGRATHVLKVQGEEVVLERIGFACVCHSAGLTAGRSWPSAFGRTRRQVRSGWQCSQS
ncbi:hypothetical protein [Mesorhizobium sp.]|uniref:hypothetical protein n=1 Tax=Mesorhizobium sp. TaxID=1871066 RepID=UPI00122A9FC3|nr:hypothetical protein [Mesorhizobium sp.]TIL43277.1 MAG: hypothetical protein E5Y86_22805 [Mesorhizobium sp.]